MPRPGRQPICVKVDEDVRAMVDTAASVLGMSRSSWLAWTIDRGLAGAGMITPETVTERREARAARPPQRDREPLLALAAQADAEVDRIAAELHQETARAQPS